MKSVDLAVKVRYQNTPRLAMLTGEHRPTKPYFGAAAFRIKPLRKTMEYERCGIPWFASDISPSTSFLPLLWNLSTHGVEFISIYI